MAGFVILSEREVRSEGSSFNMVNLELLVVNGF